MWGGGGTRGGERNQAVKLRVEQRSLDFIT